MIERIVRSGAGAAGGAGGVGAGVGAVWAHKGVAEVPRTVPTRSSAPARLKLFVFEITRPRLLCNGCSGIRPPCPGSPCPNPTSQSSAEADPRGQANPNH